MAVSHGSKATFWVSDVGSVLRDFSTYLTSAGLARLADMAEVSTFGNTSKQYIPGLLDGTIPLEGPFDPTPDGYLAGILGYEVARTFEYYPAGGPVGATKPKYSGSAFLASYEISTGVDDAATISAEIQITGTVTRAVA